MFLGLLAQPSFADMVIIVNSSNSALITKAEVRKIFMGRSKSFTNGQAAVPIELRDGPARQQFLKDVLSKEEGALNSYWSRLIFTGKGVPPRSFATAKEVVAQVAVNENMISFVDEADVDDRVKAIKFTD
jgi:hypothetical protein